MKVCKYCGTGNPKNAVMCENCGAHGFKHKCDTGDITITIAAG